MKLFWKALLFIFFVIDLGWSGENISLKIAFWNVENLFDLIDDPQKNDDEFALGGKKNVTKEMYNLKLKNSAEVLADLNADILGICEVEFKFYFNTCLSFNTV